MRKVAIIGISGSGKTTLAAEVAARLGVPHVELDALHHGPGWTEPPLEEFRARIAELVASDAWVIDNMYHGKLGEMVPLAADTVVWLDPPLIVSMARLLRRTAGRLVARTELWNGNRESLRGAFLGRDSLFGWAIQRHIEYRRTLPHQFAEPRYAGIRVERLRTAADVEGWLGSVSRHG